MSEDEVGGRRDGEDGSGAAPGAGPREPGDADLADLLREAADRRLFAGLAWREDLRDRVLSSLGGEVRGTAPRLRPWASPWLGWGGLVVAGAAAVLILVLSGPLRTGLRPGSPGLATLSRAGAESGAAPRAALQEAPAATEQPSKQVPAGTEQPSAAGGGGADAAMSGTGGRAAAAEEAPPGPTLGAEAWLAAGGVTVALRVEKAPWDSPPPLKVAVIFPGLGERMGAVEGCKREGDAWSCRALVNDVPDQARAAADLRVIVLLMQPPAEEGGAPTILAQARDVSVSR